MSHNVGTEQNSYTYLEARCNSKWFGWLIESVSEPMSLIIWGETEKNIHVLVTNNLQLHDSKKYNTFSYKEVFSHLHISC